MSLPTAAAHVARLRAEIGYTESPPGTNRTKYAAVAGHANGQPWCETFIVAMAKSGGLLLPSYSAYTPTVAQSFKATGRWHATPQVGDLAFFDFPDSVHRIQHVGTVVAFTAKTVTTIDGNTSSGPGGSEDNGGGVYERTRSRSLVVGYGRPIYAATAALEEDDDMADPAVLKLLTDISNKLTTIEHTVGRWGRKNDYADEDQPGGEQSLQLTLLTEIRDGLAALKPSP